MHTYWGVLITFVEIPIVYILQIFIIKEQSNYITYIGAFVIVVSVLVPILIDNFKNDQHKTVVVDNDDYDDDEVELKEVKMDAQ